MRAALCKSLEGPRSIVVETIPDPEPQAGEILVRVRAAALNFLDTLITRGKYQFKPELPFSPAAEIAGTVEKIGPGVHEFAVGQRVCAHLGWGGARELVSVAEQRAIAVPDDVGFEVAASLNITYGTAMHGLVDRGRLEPGETVAVLGASGGAGLAAVEVAKELGARVIAAASTKKKLEVCREHGADLLINYSDTDLKQALRDMTGGRGVDVVYDCVGGDYSEPALRSIAWQGRFLVVGFAAGYIPKIPLNLLLLKGCELAGVFFGEAARRRPQDHRRNMERVLQWVASGRIRPHIHATFPLAETAAAIALLDQRAVTGKVVVIP
jgi:NADPH2:quinone reductase